MKKIYLYTLMTVLSLVTFASCSQNDMLEDDGERNDASALTIQSVKLEGFSTPELSRASYTSEGATKFENGDRLGLLLMDKDNQQIANTPYSYADGGVWTSDNNQTYTSKIARVIAYFPYNENLSKDITTLDALKRTIELKDDQSDTETFKQMDLLTDEIEAPSSSLNIEFSHAFSMLALSASSTVKAGDESFTYNLDLSNVSLTIGEAVYKPCSLNGTYACLINGDTPLEQDEFRYSYTADGQTYVKTVTKTVTTMASTKYTFPCPLSGSNEAAVSNGDYYCTSDASGNVVIIPAKAASLPQGLTCKGIVFHIMDDFDAFCTTNGLKASDYPGFESVHGLIVSTTSGQTFGNGDANAVKTLFADTEDHANTEIANGYKLTQILKEATTITFSALSQHTESPKNATSWYTPSFMELKYLVWGGDASTSSTNGLDLINKQIKKVVGTEITGNIPSTTFKDDLGGFCLMQGADEMGWHGIPGGETWRPICAF